MSTFILKVLAIVLTIAIVGCKAENQRAMVIMRHLGIPEMQEIEAGDFPCCFDIATFTPDHGYPDAVSSLQQMGKGIVAYFNVHSVQPQIVRREWRGKWIDFLADSVMAGWGAYMVNTEGDTALYAFYGADDYLLNWAVIDSLRAERLVAAMKVAAGPHTAAFWDVYFPTLSPWMFASRGASYESFSPLVRTAYKANLERALRIARRRFEKNGQRVPFAVIVNGDWRAAPPVYLENIEQSTLGSFRDAVRIWVANPRSVGSVKGHHTAWVDSLLREWKRSGGIIAFTGDAAGIGVDRAYIRADSLRRNL